MIAAKGRYAQQVKQASVKAGKTNTLSFALSEDNSAGRNLHRGPR